MNDPLYNAAYKRACEQAQKLGQSRYICTIDSENASGWPRHIVCSFDYTNSDEFIAFDGHILEVVD